MTLTRKHFVTLAECAAEIIHNLDNPTEWEKQMVIREIAAVCKLSNPRFKSDLFIAWVEQTVKNLERGTDAATA
jgi:hypothetical protein